jgi:transposase
MTTTESEERPVDGGKPEGVRGRTTTTVRFTAARLADLRAVAASQGRSLSEEVEYRIEAYARHAAEMQEMLGQLYDHQQQIGRHQQELRTLKEKGAADKGSSAMDDERAARIAAAAIAAFVDGRKK